MEQSDESDVGSSTPLLEQFGVKMGAEQSRETGSDDMGGSSTIQSSRVSNQHTQDRTARRPKKKKSLNIPRDESEEEEYVEEVPKKTRREGKPESYKKIDYLKHWRNIKFIEGHKYLNRLPRPCSFALGRYCQRAETVDLPCSGLLWASDRRLAGNSDGATTWFFHKQTGRELQAARYQYGRRRQIVVVDGPGLQAPSIIAYSTTANTSAGGFSGFFGRWKVWDENGGDKLFSVVRVDGIKSPSGEGGSVLLAPSRPGEPPQHIPGYRQEEVVDQQATASGSNKIPMDLPFAYVLTSIGLHTSLPPIKEEDQTQGNNEHRKRSRDTDETERSEKHPRLDSAVLGPTERSPEDVNVSAKAPVTFAKHRDAGLQGSGELHEQQETVAANSTRVEIVRTSPASASQSDISHGRELFDTPNHGSDLVAVRTTPSITSDAAIQDDPSATTGIQRCSMEPLSYSLPVQSMRFRFVNVHGNVVRQKPFEKCDSMKKVFNHARCAELILDNSGILSIQVGLDRYAKKLTVMNDEEDFDRILKAAGEQKGDILVMLVRSIDE